MISSRCRRTQSPEATLDSSEQSCLRTSGHNEMDQEQKPVLVIRKDVSVEVATDDGSSDLYNGVLEAYADNSSHGHSESPQLNRRLPPFL